MFEILVSVVFLLFFISAIRLTLKVAWGLAKIAAVILFVLSLPLLVGCLLYASGLILLLPLVLITAAWGILKVCI